MSFVDEPPNQRVNRERAKQALETGANVVAVGCPFCMTMMEDGVKACQAGSTSEPVTVMDVAEMLWEAVRDQASEGIERKKEKQETVKRA